MFVGTSQQWRSTCVQVCGDIVVFKVCSGLWELVNSSEQHVSGFGSPINSSVQRVFGFSRRGQQLCSMCTLGCGDYSTAVFNVCPGL